MESYAYGLHTAVCVYVCVCAYVRISAYTQNIWIGNGGGSLNSSYGASNWLCLRMLTHKNAK